MIRRTKFTRTKENVSDDAWHHGQVLRTLRTCAASFDELDESELGAKKPTMSEKPILFDAIASRPDADRLSSGSVFSFAAKFLPKMRIPSPPPVPQRPSPACPPSSPPLVSATDASEAQDTTPPSNPAPMSLLAPFSGNMHDSSDSDVDGTRQRSPRPRRPLVARASPGTAGTPATGDGDDVLMPPLATRTGTSSMGQSSHTTGVPLQTELPIAAAAATAGATAVAGAAGATGVGALPPVVTADEVAAALPPTATLSHLHAGLLRRSVNSGDDSDSVSWGPSRRASNASSSSSSSSSNPTSARSRSSGSSGSSSSSSSSGSSSSDSNGDHAAHSLRGGSVPSTQSIGALADHSAGPYSAPLDRLAHTDADTGPPAPRTNAFDMMRNRARAAGATTMTPVAVAMESDADSSNNSARSSCGSDSGSDSDASARQRPSPNDGHRDRSASSAAAAASNDSDASGDGHDDDDDDDDPLERIAALNRRAYERACTRHARRVDLLTTIEGREARRVATLARKLERASTSARRAELLQRIDSAKDQVLSARARLAALVPPVGYMPDQPGADGACVAGPMTGVPHDGAVHDGVAALRTATSEGTLVAAAAAAPVDLSHAAGGAAGDDVDDADELLLLGRAPRAARAADAAAAATPTPAAATDAELAGGDASDASMAARPPAPSPPTPPAAAAEVAPCDGGAAVEDPATARYRLALDAVRRHAAAAAAVPARSGPVVALARAAPAAHVRPAWAAGGCNNDVEAIAAALRAKYADASSDSDSSSSSSGVSSNASAGARKCADLVRQLRLRAKANARASGVAADLDDLAAYDELLEQQLGGGGTGPSRRGNAAGLRGAVSILGRIRGRRRGAPARGRAASSASSSADDDDSDWSGADWLGQRRAAPVAAARRPAGQRSRGGPDSGDDSGDGFAGALLGADDDRMSSDNHASEAPVAPPPPTTMAPSATAPVVDVAAAPRPRPTGLMDRALARMRGAGPPAAPAQPATQPGCPDADGAAHAAAAPAPGYSDATPDGTDVTARDALRVDAIPCDAVLRIDNDEAACADSAGAATDVAIAADTAHPIPPPAQLHEPSRCNLPAPPSPVCVYTAPHPPLASGSEGPVATDVPAPPSTRRVFRRRPVGPPAPEATAPAQAAAREPYGPADASDATMSVIGRPVLLPSVRDGGCNITSPDTGPEDAALPQPAATQATADPELPAPPCHGAAPPSPIAATSPAHDSTPDCRVPTATISRAPSTQRAATPAPPSESTTPPRSSPRPSASPSPPIASHPSPPPTPQPSPSCSPTHDATQTAPAPAGPCKRARSPTRDDDSRAPDEPLALARSSAHRGDDAAQLQPPSGKSSLPVAVAIAPAGARGPPPAQRAPPGAMRPLMALRGAGQRPAPASGGFGLSSALSVRTPLAGMTTPRALGGMSTAGDLAPLRSLRSMTTQVSAADVENLCRNNSFATASAAQSIARVFSKRDPK